MDQRGSDGKARLHPQRSQSQPARDPRAGRLRERDPGRYRIALSGSRQVSRTFVEARQSNSEAELIGWVQEARSAACAIVINAAAYSHTSIALHDALKTAGVPVIEIHLSNIYKREAFRHRSHVSPVATGVICGFGGHGYELALEALAEILSRTPG
jgi:3-dehydroquinate dehydratase